MRSRIGKGYVAAAVMAVAVALLAASMVAPVISTTTDFSIYNSDWNGVSELAVLTYRAGKFVPTFEVATTGTEISIANLGLEDLDLDPKTAALVIIGPDKAFTEAEGRMVGDFVRSGGKLLLADDFGTANTLLEPMGSTSRFSGQLVMDLAYEKKPEFSVCFDIEPDAVTRNVSTILLNYPSSIVVDSTTTEVMARSSVASWLDTNNDRDQEWGEPRGPFPILARERLGAGEILLLSDPSVLINGMRGYMNNSALGSNLVSEISEDRSEVYFDESHRQYFDPVSVTAAFTADMPAEGRLVLVVLVFLLTLWITTEVVERALAFAYRGALTVGTGFVDLLGLKLLRGRKPGPSEPLDIERVVSESVQKHPEWRPGILRYILKEGPRHGKALEERAASKDAPAEVTRVRDGETDGTGIGQ